MLSKFTKLRRLINNAYRQTTSKVHRVAGVNKDAYFMLAEKYLDRGIDPKMLFKPIASHSVRSNAEKLRRRATVQDLAKNIYHAHYYPQVAVEDAYVEVLQKDLKITDLTGLEEKPEVPYAQVIDHLPEEAPLPPDFTPLPGTSNLFDMARGAGFTHVIREQIYHPPGSFKQQLVDEGFIQPDEEVPEDPPEGWVPPDPDENIKPLVLMNGTENAPVDALLAAAEAEDFDPDIASEAPPLNPDVEDIETQMAEDPDRDLRDSDEG